MDVRFPDVYADDELGDKVRRLVEARRTTYAELVRGLLRREVAAEFAAAGRGAGS